ncbi:MAG: trigger factor [Luteolibacter sp.]
MNITVDKQAKCKATLKVEIPADQVSGQRQSIVSKYAGQARVPGFRPGKAPKDVIEKRYHKQITEELNENLFNLAIDEAIQKEELKVLNYGAPQNLLASPDGGLAFTTELIMAPNVSLPNYKGIEVKIPSEDVPEEALEEQLKQLQERFADFEDITDRAAEMGDFAVIDYSSTVEGKPTEEFIGKSAGYIGGREGFWLKLDEQAFLPGFADEVVGMKAEDSKDITITMPDDFPVADLIGKEVVFATTMKELKTSILPELNDEFAGKLAPEKTLDEVKEMILENLQEERKRAIQNSKMNQVVEAMTAEANFELPEELINQETQSQADSMVQRGMQSGMDEETIASQEAEIFASATQAATNNLRTNFILQEIAIAEKLEVSDQELVGQITQMASQRKQAPKKFIKELQRNGQIPSIRNNMLVSKAIDFVVSEAKVEVSEEAEL